MATSGSICYILSACLFVGLVVVADGSAFRTPTPVLQQMRAEDMRAAMLDELLSGLGSGNRVTGDRLATLEEAMRPIFLSLPKNTEGNLDHGTVRYLLHRIFVLRHGMFIKGLHPGEEVEVNSTTMVLEDRVPTFVQALFEERLQERGLGLHEVAMLAATLEHLIQDENLKMLKFAYEAYGTSVDDHVPESLAGDIVEMYMVFFISGWNETANNIDVKRELEFVRRVFPIWPASREFAAQVLKEVVGKNVLSSNPDRNSSKLIGPASRKSSNPSSLPFSVVASAVEEIGDRYGQWQNHDCMDMKSDLLSMEISGTGRVLLQDFYGHGSSVFSESKALLQELGVLDESNPKRPRVIIPNYINSVSQCFASSSMLSVCCLNECEGLLGHVEREVAGPDETPDRILGIVANLPSSSVQAPRVLPQILHSRLQNIATHHGEGRVPLHGRLFNQWMHNAFPRECPYPQKDTGNSSLIANRAAISSDMMVTTEEKMFHISALSPSSEEIAEVANEGITMWSTEEMLLVVSRPAPTSNLRSSLRNIALLAVVGSSCVALYRTAVSALRGSGKQSTLPFSSKAHFC